MWPFPSKFPEFTAQQSGVSVLFLEKDLRDATYDYIVCEGGTAGCVLARRLSEDPSVTVLVIERGPVHDDFWGARIPVISSDINTDRMKTLKWKSLPIAGANGRALNVYTAQILGGGSRLNSMIYTRGAPGDWNLWRDLGHPGWAYDKMLPYFIKSEKTLSQPRSNYRGHDGVWSNQTCEVIYNIQKCVNVACEQSGLPFVSDINSPHTPASCNGLLDTAIDFNMERASALSAFLPKQVVLERASRLNICTNTVVDRIDFSSDSTPRAQGVYIQSVDSTGLPRQFYARVRKEIIVCGGALVSLQILQLSGIGPASLLEEMYIPVVCNLPGKDHVGLPIMYKVLLADSMHLYLVGIWAVLLEVLKYLWNKSGFLGRGALQTAIFVCTSLLDSNYEIHPSSAEQDLTESANRPDLEIMPCPISSRELEPGEPIQAFGVFTLLNCLILPKSTGFVQITSRNPRQNPTVSLGFLEDEEDFEVLRRGCKLSLRLAAKVRAQGYSLEDYEGPHSESTQDLDDFIRANCRTSYHYTSTCRMAKRELGGVVDDELRVYGVQGVRVCDASIFPEIFANHLMAPVVAVAERCADFVKAANCDV